MIKVFYKEIYLRNRETYLWLDFTGNGEPLQSVLGQGVQSNGYAKIGT